MSAQLRSVFDRTNASFAVVAVVVVFGSLLGNVVFQTAILQTRLELDEINGQLSDAREENRRLRLDVMELEAPERVLQGAVEDLGMVRPDARRYLPGIDPTIEEIRLPGVDPFGPGPLPEFLIAPDPESESEPARESSESSDSPDETPADITVEEGA